MSATTTPSASRTRPIAPRLALALGVVALACGALAASLVLASDRVDGRIVTAVLAVSVGWSLVGCGLIVWRQRPENPLGRVMVATGFAWFASFLMVAAAPLAFTVGTAVGDLFFVGFVYLLLSFPTGRLPGRLDRFLFGAAVVMAAVVTPAYLLLGSQRVFCTDCPRNVMQVVDADGAASWVLGGQRVVAACLALLVAVLLAGRFVRATPPQRRAASPVMGTGSALLAAVALSSLNDALDTPLGDAPAWILTLTVAALPVAVLTVLIRQRLDRGAVAGLVVDFETQALPGDPRVPLTRALGDPSLELVYWLPVAQHYVDREGSPRKLPGPGGTRAVTLVQRGDQPIAALLHDPALNENPDLVRSVASAAALAIENERLHAELQARLLELQASRARLVDEGERERRRIERNLHDGAQQRLIAVSMTLGLAGVRAQRHPEQVRPLLDEAKNTLALAMDELRELSQGIHPGVLAERGLDAALDDLARSAALPVTIVGSVGGRLGEGAEGAAYFVVSELLANAAKYAHAQSIEVTVSRDENHLRLQVSDNGIGGADPARGSGLRGLVDRVEALGGRLSVSSPPGRGTLVDVELPCG